MNDNLKQQNNNDDPVQDQTEDTSAETAEEVSQDQNQITETQAEEQASTTEEQTEEKTSETQAEEQESDAEIQAEEQTEANDNLDTADNDSQALPDPQAETTKETSESEEQAGIDDSAVEPQSDDEDTSESSKGRWYVVHTYSGHENKVATTLKQRVESEHLEEKIFDVLVPMQDKIEIRSGKKTEVKEKIFPGYILVKMELDDQSWLAVRTTQGVTSFVGIGNKPTPISDREVQTIVKFTQIQHPTFKQIFSVNDTVKIIDGPFAEFIGKVDSVDEEKGKVRVLVSIFGRETPVELDFLQIQKI